MVPPSGQSQDFPSESLNSLLGGLESETMTRNCLSNMNDLITRCDRIMFTHSQDVWLQPRSLCTLCTWECTMLEETQSPPHPRVAVYTHRSKASLLPMVSLHEIENNVFQRSVYPNTCANLRTIIFSASLN